MENNINRENNNKDKFSIFKQAKTDDKVFYKLISFCMFVICILLFIVIIINFALNAVAKAKKEKEINSFKKTEAIPNVISETVSLSRYNEFINMNATLKSLSGVVNVFSPVQGKLKENKVRLGDVVKKNDILGYVDASDIGVSYKLAPIYSLSDGVVSAINSVSGETVYPNSVLYTVVPESDYVISASVSEQNAGVIKPGDNAYFTTVGNPNVVFKAVLRYVSPMVRESDRTVALEFTVINDENKKLLKQGMLVSLDLECNVKKNVITVATDAISKMLNDKIVYVIDDENKVSVRKVETSDNNTERTVITSGLNVGEKIVITGNIKDGDTVNIVNR